MEKRPNTSTLLALGQMVKVPNKGVGSFAPGPAQADAIAAATQTVTQMTIFEGTHLAISTLLQPEPIVSASPHTNLPSASYALGAQTTSQRLSSGSAK